MSANGTNATLDTGTYTNGTFWPAGYDPNLDAPFWHQRMELATICVCNSLTLIVIVARIWYRKVKIQRFRYTDAWIAVAGFFLIPYWASQIGTNIYGSGLHDDNTTVYQRRMHWHFTPGWAGYYIVASCIKMSVCFCFLEILPYHLDRLRYSVYALCTLITALGITMTFSWLFECTPILSNFLWSIESDKCVNYDIFRWLWIALSIPIDICILIVPARLLHKVQLRKHEKRILRTVFSATILGTITCAVGIYGVYTTRTGAQLDGFYVETPFLMMNDIEILMYAIGACVPVLSRYLVNRVDSEKRGSTGFETLARRFPNFLLGLSRRTTRHTRTTDNVTPQDPHSSGPHSPVKSIELAFNSKSPDAHSETRLDIDMQRRDPENGGYTMWNESQRGSSED